jgi:hypothetical protein
LLDAAAGVHAAEGGGAAIAAANAALLVQLVSPAGVWLLLQCAGMRGTSCRYLLVCCVAVEEGTAAALSQEGEALHAAASCIAYGWWAM